MDLKRATDTTTSSDQFRRTNGSKGSQRGGEVQFYKRAQKLDAGQCVEEIKYAFSGEQRKETDAELLLKAAQQQQQRLALQKQTSAEEEEDDEADQDISTNQQESPEALAAKEKEKAKKKNAAKLILCTAACRYNVIKRVCRRMEFKLNDDDVKTDWDLYWSDVGVQPEQISKVKPYQRINSHPGMQALARKNNLARNLMRVAKVYPKDFNFFPKTWVLPSDQNDFKNQFNKKKAKTFIIKPVNMCQGKGIYLTRRFEDVDLKSGEQLVAQRYMAKPYLIDELKFDLRIYVLIYGVEPLRVFVFKEGLARFATEQYTGPNKNNLDNLYMHLTNYAINKNSGNFVKSKGEDDDSANKRTLSSILEYLEEHEEGFSAERMMDKIEDIAVKTCIAVQPALAHAFRTCQPDDLENSCCFQILGMDIMIDQKLKPWLIEINHLSSFQTDSPLDKKVKFDLVWDTFNMLNMSLKRKKKTKKQSADQFSRRMHKEAPLTKNQKESIKYKNMRERDAFDRANLRGYRQSYPHPDANQQLQYEHILEETKLLWNEFTNGSTRGRDGEPTHHAYSHYHHNTATNNHNHHSGAYSGGSRTNPPTVKSKAIDLHSPNTTQQQQTKVTPHFVTKAGQQHSQQSSNLNFSNTLVNNNQQTQQLQQINQNGGGISKMSSTNNSSAMMMQQHQATTAASTNAAVTASSSSSQQQHQKQQYGFQSAERSNGQTNMMGGLGCLADGQNGVMTPQNRGTKAQRIENSGGVVGTTGGGGFGRVAGSVSKAAGLTMNGGGGKVTTKQGYPASLIFDGEHIDKVNGQFQHTMNHQTGQQLLLERQYSLFGQVPPSQQQEALTLSRHHSNGKSHHIGQNQGGPFPTNNSSQRGQRTDSKRNNAGQRAGLDMTSTSKKASNGESQQRVYHHGGSGGGGNQAQRAAFIEQQRTAALQKKFPMIKLDHFQQQYMQNQNPRLAFAQNQVSQSAENNQKCPVHHHHQNNGQSAIAMAANQQNSQQKQHIYHKSNSVEQQNKQVGSILTRSPMPSSSHKNNNPQQSQQNAGRSYSQNPAANQQANINGVSSRDSAVHRSVNGNMSTGQILSKKVQNGGPILSSQINNSNNISHPYGPATMPIKAMVEFPPHKMAAHTSSTSTTTQQIEKQTSQTKATALQLFQKQSSLNNNQKQFQNNNGGDSLNKNKNQGMIQFVTPNMSHHQTIVSPIKQSSVGQGKGATHSSALVQGYEQRKQLREPNSATKVQQNAQGKYQSQSFHKQQTQQAGTIYETQKEQDKQLMLRIKTGERSSGVGMTTNQQIQPKTYQIISTNSDQKVNLDTMTSNLNSKSGPGGGAQTPTTIKPKNARNTFFKASWVAEQRQSVPINSRSPTTIQKTHHDVNELILESGSSPKATQVVANLNNNQKQRIGAGNFFMLRAPQVDLGVVGKRSGTDPARCAVNRSALDQLNLPF